MFFPVTILIETDLSETGICEQLAFSSDLLLGKNYFLST